MLLDTYRDNWKNQKTPNVVIRESAAKIQLQRERRIVGDIPEFRKDSDDKYLVHGNVHKKNDKFQNTNPGAFYALTTVVTTSSTTLSGIIVWEDYEECIVGDPEIGELGLGSVVVFATAGRIPKDNAANDVFLKNCLLLSLFFISLLYK